MRRTGQISATLAAFALMGSVAQAGTLEHFTSFFAFGDSLSDNGNLYAAAGGTFPPSPPYFNGRFSNGPVWAEAVMADFAAKGLATAGFAFGAANAIPNADAIPDLPTQLGIFAATVPGAALGSRPLAALWFGANDVFDAVDALLPLSGVEAVARGAAQAVGSAALYAFATFGIRDFVIFNIPDLGRIPAYALDDPALIDAPNAAIPGTFTPDLADEATAGAEAFNAQIGDEIDTLRLLGANVIEVDIYGLFSDLLDDPAAYGLSDVTLPCVIRFYSVCTPAQAAERAFFDPVHPHALIHAAIADQVRAQVAPVPLPLPAAMLGAGLAGLFAVSRRRA